MKRLSLILVLHALSIWTSANVDYYAIYEAMIEGLSSPDQKIRNQALDIASQLAYDSNAPLNIQANGNIVLGNYGINTGDLTMLNEVESNYKRIRSSVACATLDPGITEQTIDSLIDVNKKYRQAISEQTAPFVNRISGLWISGEKDDQGAPKLAIHLYYDAATNTFSTMVDPNCQSIKLVENCYLSDDVTVSGADGTAELYFGTNKRTGGKTSLAKTLSDYGAELSHTGVTTIAAKNANKPLSAENVLGQTAFNIIGGLMQHWAAKAAITYDWNYMLTATLIEDPLIPGIATLHTDYYVIVVASTGKVSTFNFGESDTRMYKVSEDDGVSFLVTDEKPIYNYRGGEADHALGLNENGKFKIKSFNEVSYRRLHDKYKKQLYDNTPAPALKKDAYGLYDDESREALKEYELLGDQLDMELGQTYYHCCFVKKADLNRYVDEVYFAGLCEHPTENAIVLNYDNINTKREKAINGVVMDLDAYEYYEQMLNDMHPVYGKMYEKVRVVSPLDELNYMYIPALLYEGQFKDQLFDGYGTQYDGKGNVLRQGHFKKGQFKK